MSSHLRFVRFRGRVRGPFSIQELQRMIQRRQLSRSHELSIDRKVWIPAGEDESLYPREVEQEPVGVAASSRQEQQEASYATVERSSAGGTQGQASLSALAAATSEPEPVHARAVTEDRRVWYCVVNEEQRGPMPPQEVINLFNHGRIDRDALVWAEGLSNWVSLDQSGLIAPTGGPQAGRRKGDSKVGSVEGLWRSLMVMQIVAGAVILVAMHIPFVAEEEAFFWWDEPIQGGGGFFMVMLLLAGLALPIVSPLTSGLARAITVLSIGTVLAVMMLWGTLETRSSELVLLFLGSLSLTGLAAMNAIRVRPQLDGDGPRIAHGILGGVTALLFLIHTIVMVIRMLGVETSGEAAGYVLAAILIAIALACPLAAGICGLCALNPDAPKTLFKAITIMTILTPALIGAALIIATTQGIMEGAELFGPMTSEDRSIAFQIYLLWLRVIAIFVAIYLIIGSGLAELVGRLIHRSAS